MEFTRCLKRDNSAATTGGASRFRPPTNIEVASHFGVDVVSTLRHVISRCGLPVYAAQQRLPEPDVLTFFVHANFNWGTCKT